MKEKLNDELLGRKQLRLVTGLDKLLWTYALVQIRNLLSSLIHVTVFFNQVGGTAVFNSSRQHVYIHPEVPRMAVPPLWDEAVSGYAGGEGGDGADAML